MDGPGQTAGIANGQGKAVSRVRVGGKGDRGLAEMRHGNHHELAGFIGKTMPGQLVDQVKMIGVDQVVFPDDFPDHRLVGQVDVAQACPGLPAGIQAAGGIGFRCHCLFPGP